jgi:Zn-dependent protease
VLFFFLRDSNNPNFVPILVAYIIAIIGGMTVHEFAHNYAAHRMGDPYPSRNGRLTFNPLVHIDVQGFIMFLLIGFGALGSAPVSPDRLPLQNRRYRWLTVVAAGPVSNLLLAVVVAIAYRLTVGTPTSDTAVLELMLNIIMLVNISLFLFNLLPFFPIDGWQIMFTLLPPDLARVWQRYQRESFYVLLGLIALGFVVPGLNIIGYVLNGPAQMIFGFLIGRG